MNKLEKIAMDKAVATITEFIDWGIISDILAEQGWTKVSLPRATFDEEHIEIIEWITDACLAGKYKNFDEDFIFENEGDAALFILRWL